MILAILLGDAFPGTVPSWLSRDCATAWLVTRGVSSGLVRQSLCSLSAGLSHASLRSSCQPDGTPGEGCLTEVWPEASDHTRWRNEMVRRGNHHYGEGRQRLWTPPPVVSQGPRERCFPVLLANLLPQDMESRRLGACTGPILAGTPVRRHGVLGAHVLGHRHGSDPGR